MWGELKKRLSRGKKVLLLLSGGSAVKVYQSLAGQMQNQPEGFAQNLTVGLIDERFGQVGHSDSNEEQIRQTGFYEEVQKKGGKVLSVLTGRDPEQEAARYELALRKYMTEADEVWAVLGIGSDGHTAGILPQKSEEVFNKTFPANHWVVYYKLARDYPNPFKKRISLTPQSLEQIDLAVVVVKSRGKEEALKRMLLPNEPPYKTPAVLLRGLNGFLFTDATPKV